MGLSLVALVGDGSPMGIVLGPEHPFWGAREKVLRAGEHLNALDAEFAEWCNRYPDGLVAVPEVEEIDAETGEYLATLTFDVNPPTWGVVVGEFLHDLRSALNHLLVTVCPSPTEHTQFPCAITTQDYASCGPMIAGIPAEYLPVIEAAQPYHRGDKAAAKMHPLKRLADLNNRDKHHLLLVTLLGLQDATGRFTTIWEHPDVRSVQFNIGPSEKDVKVVNVQFGDEVDADVKAKPSVGVVFDEPELPSVHRMSVEPILAEMLATSRGIVEDFFGLLT